MQKSGVVTLRKSNASYYFVWISDGLSLERIDVIKNLDTYNPIITSGCIASYYKKTKEFVLGDETIIQAMKLTVNTALTVNAKAENLVDVVDGEVRLTVSKEDAGSGVRYKLVLLGGRTDVELYETPDCVVDVQRVSSSEGFEVAPINLSEYTTYSLLEQEYVPSGDADYYPLEYLKQVYPLDHIEDNDFVVVTSMQEAEERLQRFIEAETDLKAIDIETTGTDINVFGEDLITGIVLSYTETESTYYPFRQDKCSFNLPKSFIGRILDAVNNQPRNVKILAYNGMFEKKGFWKERPEYLKHSKYISAYEDVTEDVGLATYDMRLDADPYLLSVLCNPVQQKGLHSLKGNTNRITGQFYLELENIFKDKKNIKFNVLPPEIIRYYACPDTANTIKVYRYLIEKLPKDELGIFELECQLVEVKAINEFYGMRIDLKLLGEKIQQESFVTDMLEDMFKKMHNTTKNINSPEVRRDIFYNKLRCPVVVRTTKNLPSTSKYALEQILKDGALRDYDKEHVPADIVGLDKKTVIKGEELVKNRYPSLVILSQYAKSAKQLGAYKRIQAHSARDRVQFYINQVGAGSGRQTSDAHQYSDGMKELVLSDSDEHWLWSADYKQVELRILAYLARQEDLIELEKDPCVDVHRAVLSIITGKEIWAISDAERKKGKSVNFGVVYMMTEYGLAAKLFGVTYNKEEELEALNAINSFYNNLPQIKRFVEGNKSFVRKHGYIKTKMGRRRYFRQALDPTISQRKLSSIERAANNTPVQGFGADLLKIVEVSINSYIKEQGWDELVDCNGVLLPKVRLMLSIHDEVLVSSHKSIPIEEIIKMFKVCMEVEIKGAPPFFSAPAMISNWYDGKNDAYEIDLLFRDEILKAWENGHKRLLHSETYLEDLNAYRSKRLNEYMYSLIKKYGDFEAVWKHVTHPELTHTLISVMLGKKAKSMDHLEAIKESTRLFMEGHKEAVFVGVGSNSEEATEDGVSSYEELSEFIRVDENGELIIEGDGSDWEDEEDEVTEEKIVAKCSNAERSYVQYTMCEALVDLGSVGSLDYAKCIDAKIKELHNPNSSYQVVYLYKGRLMPTSIKVSYANSAKINDIMREAEAAKGGYAYA